LISEKSKNFAALREDFLVVLKQEAMVSRKYLKTKCFAFLEKGA
jgi:hypothetical protein